MAQNVGDFVKHSPRATYYLPIVVARRLGGEDTHKDLLVRWQRVFDAIVLLEGNNTFYSDNSINTDALAALPDKGTLKDLPLASEHRDPDEERDTGPEQNDASEGRKYTEFFQRSVVRNGMQEDAMIKRPL